MKAWSTGQRTSALETMAREGVDILVVGGGITGAGVALDAAARGYRVGLVEKGDFASGTSSKSTKLVHGGIRYLPQFAFSLVREGLIERGLLLRNAPFLVQPVAFVLPLYARARHPLGTPIVPPLGLGLRHLLRSGLLLYDLLAGRWGLGRHQRLGTRRALALVPGLRKEGLVDAFLYVDAQTDDARLTITVLRTAAAQGALLANYAAVEGFDQAAGRIVAARVRDEVWGGTFTIRAGTVVNAAGVFANRVEALAGGVSHIRVEPAKGVHLTVSREAVGIRQDALVLPETDDGRILFIVPWGSRAIVGTTDTVGGDVDRPEATDEDISYLLRHVNRYASRPLGTGDIISTWAGFRPLLRSGDDTAPSANLSRTHAVVDGSGGMVCIVGGKLTTYRKMAQDALDRVAHLRGDRVRHLTAQLPLAGSEGWQAELAAATAAAPVLGLPSASLQHLRQYGAAAGEIVSLLEEDVTLTQPIVADLPYIMAEVVYACRHEMAINLDDVLARRLPIVIEDREHGVAAAPAVAARLARELGWDEAETKRQVERYRALYNHQSR